ncbi:MAG: RidA family protein [Alphaproteobacteria bacterium]|nr:RidA family protein [Alphaproteobacteria bacterium]
MIEFLQPDGWAPPRGYANGVTAEGRMVFVGGQIGWNPGTAAFETDDFAEQVEIALRNTVAVVAEAGGRPEHIVRLTWFVTDKQAYLSDPRALGAAYRNVMGRHFPAMSVVEVTALVEDRAQVEIEATAVIPNS